MGTFYQKNYNKVKIKLGATMKFLLINTNQIVQKLVEITAKKAGADLTTIKELNEIDNLETYNYVIVDDDCLEGDGSNALETLKDKRKCLIHNKQTSRIEGFNDYIQKPFLPTTILDVFMAEAEREGGGYASQTPEIQNTSTDNVESFDEGSENLDESLGEVSALDEDIQAGDDENLGESTTQTQDELLDSEFAETLDSALDELGEISELSAATENGDEIQASESLQETDPKENEEVENTKSGDMELDLSSENKNDVQSEKADEGEAELSDTELALDDLQLNEDADLEDLASELDLGDLENDELNVNLSEETADLTEDSILNANLDNELDENLEQITTESDDDSSSELENLPTEEKATDEQPILEDLALDDLESFDSINSIQESETPTEASNATEDELNPENIGSGDELLADLADEPTENIENTESVESTEITEDFESAPTESIDDSEPETEMNPDELPLSILDSEQIQEVSQALNALESSPDQESLEKSETDLPEISESTAVIDTPSQTIGEDEQNDFSALNEPEIAQALGEEFAKLDSDESAGSPVDSIATTQEAALDISQTDVVKNIITSSVQNSISSLSSGNLKAMLDGLEVTINISFKDKSK